MTEVSWFSVPGHTTSWITYTCGDYIRRWRLHTRLCRDLIMQASRLHHSPVRHKQPRLAFCTTHNLPLFGRERSKMQLYFASQSYIAYGSYIGFASYIAHYVRSCGWNRSAMKSSLRSDEITAWWNPASQGYACRAVGLLPPKSNRNSPQVNITSAGHITCRKANIIHWKWI